MHFAVSTIFDPVNTHLQSEEPLIHKLRRILLDLCKNILAKFVKVDALVAAEDDIVNFDCEITAVHKDDTEITIGSAARKALSKLNTDSRREVYSGVKLFYITAFKYLTSKLQALKDDFYKHCEVADTAALRTTAKFSSILYFVNRYNLINVSDDARLEQQFQLYQSTSDIPPADRIDIQWHLISQTDHKEQLKFDALGRVMSVILAIPHSNADCERVFSLVRK